MGVMRGWRTLEGSVMVNTSSETVCQPRQCTPLSLPQECALENTTSSLWMRFVGLIAPFTCITQNQGIFLTSEFSNDLQWLRSITYLSLYQEQASNCLSPELYWAATLGILGRQSPRALCCSLIWVIYVRHQSVYSILHVILLFYRQSVTQTLVRLPKTPSL